MNSFMDISVNFFQPKSKNIWTSGLHFSLKKKRPKKEYNLTSNVKTVLFTDEESRKGPGEEPKYKKQKPKK